MLVRCPVRVLALCRAVADAVARGAAAHPVALLPAVAAALTLRLVDAPVGLLALSAAVLQEVCIFPLRWVQWTGG